MIFFLEKNLYKFLIGKSLNIDKLTSLFTTNSDPAELKKYITPLAYLKISLINNLLSTLVSHDAGDTVSATSYDDYAQSLTQEEREYVQQDIQIGFANATPQGDTEKYYEVIKAPNGQILIAYDNYIATHLSASKDNLLRLLHDVMAKEYQASLLYPDLLKKYLAVKDSAFNINTVKLRLLNSH